jgi:hypothetical protein
VLLADLFINSRVPVALGGICKRGASVALTGPRGVGALEGGRKGMLVVDSRSLVFNSKC